MGYSLIERSIRKIKNNIVWPLTASIRRKKLNNTDFTIISNNCWGGCVYEYFGLRKNSPTIGSYFYASDYVKFVKNLKYYTSFPIEMISAEESKFYDLLKEKGEQDVPVGRLDDIEIIFLHYKDPEIAREKWNRRCKRINWDNIIYKFSYMNECTDSDILSFADATRGKKRVILTKRKIEGVTDCTVLSSRACGDAKSARSENGQISDDTFYFYKEIDLIDLINSTVLPI